MELTEAREAWAGVAREVLVATASKYRATITYKELATQLQDQTGIRTKTLQHHWIGDVLRMVSDENVKADEPLLCSLCVNAKGSVGAGYGNLIDTPEGEELPADLDLHAAAARLECYRKWASDLPATGGSPALVEQEASRREREAKKAAELRPRPHCPTCFLRLPASGHCDTCAASL